MPEVRCPGCQSTLDVDSGFLGQDVRCSECNRVFTAEVRRRAERDEPREDRDRPMGRIGWNPEDDDRPSRRRRYRDDEEDDDDDDDRPRRRRRRSRDDDDERDDDDRAKGMIMAPAIAIIVVGILGLMYGVFNALVVPPPNQLNAQQANQPGFKTGYYLAIYTQPIWGTLVTGGGLLMLTRKAYPIAIGTAILAMLPCNVVCVLSFGFGIWALMVLMKPEVKRSFGT